MSQNKHKGFRLPAEWEPQSAIQLTWPHAHTDWAPYLEDITHTFLELTEEIARRQKLLVVTQDVAHTKAQIEAYRERSLPANIVFYQCETNDTWARDHGVITMVSEQCDGQSIGTNRLLDFKFNGWGEKFDWQKDNDINRQLHAQGAFSGVLVSHSDFVLEGGSIESDGKGTIMTTASCLLAPHRNQPLSRQDIENRLLNCFNAHRVIWIEHGNLAGDDTDGHIDTIVRMAPDDTLLYIGTDDESDEQYADFKAMEQQLMTLRTLDNRPYRLLKLPMPAAMYDDGERLPATYANFVILNGAVIVPTYGQPHTDAQAMKTIGEAFPRHDIVGIDASTVVRQHGSLHCLTMQFPQGVVVAPTI